MLLARPPIDSGWLASELTELERLVEQGETLELVGHLSALVAEPRRVGVEVAAAAETAQAPEPA